jgi:hypothetical protein
LKGKVDDAHYGVKITTLDNKAEEALVRISGEGG